MKITVKKGAKKSIGGIEIKPGSLAAQLAAGTQGKVTLKTPFGNVDLKNKGKAAEEVIKEEVLDKVADDIVEEVESEEKGFISSIVNKIKG